jgi:hypothetical protein
MGRHGTPGFKRNIRNRCQKVGRYEIGDCHGWRSAPYALCVKPLLLLSITLLGLCQCQSTAPGRVEGIDTNPFQLLEKQATAANHDLSRLQVPLLGSPSFEKRWGKPKILVGPKGGYGLRYQDPAHEGTHLTIFGSPTRFGTAGTVPPPYTDLGFDRQSGTVQPREVRQEWQHARIAGRDVRFYISEADSPQDAWHYSTETFRMTAPDGRPASYRIRMGSAMGNSPAEVIRALGSLQFE